MSGSSTPDKQNAGAGAYVILLLISVYCLVPFAWLITASFDSNPSQFIRWPTEWTAQNYTRIFTDEDGGRWLLNSLVVVGGATVLVAVLAGLGGYALSRINAWWKLPFLYLILLVRVLPHTALIVPLYKVLLTANRGIEGVVVNMFGARAAREIMRYVGFIDSYLGLIVVLAAMQLPLALWIMKTFFDGVSREYEEAAIMDGATMIQRVTRVLVPLAMPGLAAAGLFSFIFAWGDFLTPLIFTSSPELQMLPLGLFRAFLRVNSIDYGLLAALAIVYLLPSVIAFAFARKFLVRTFSGGVKG